MSEPDATEGFYPLALVSKAHDFDCGYKYKVDPPKIAVPSMARGISLQGILASLRQCCLLPASKGEAKETTPGIL
jgi:hypothetical protein